MKNEIGIGHNGAPEPTPFETVKSHITDLYEEAKNWLDGAPIQTQEQADEIQKLLRLIQSAEKQADEARKDEAKPFDDAKAEIQERYNPLIGKTKSVTGLTIRAIDACKQALAPYLKRIDDENKAKAEAARMEAEAKARLAMEAMQQRDGTDLVASERAEALVLEAKQAESDARRAENAKASAKGEGRAASLRTSYRAEITDMKAFARYAWQYRQSEMHEFLEGLAQKIASTGRIQIDGVTVHEERKVA